MSGCKTNNKHRKQWMNKKPKYFTPRFIRKQRENSENTHIEKKIQPKAQIAQRNFVNEEKRGDFFLN